MDVVDRILYTARTYSLVAVKFLDRNGLIGGRPITHVIMEFSNGEEFKITYKRFMSNRVQDFEFEIGNRDFFEN